MKDYLGHKLERKTDVTKISQSMLVKNMKKNNLLEDTLDFLLVLPENI